MIANKFRNKQFFNKLINAYITKNGRIYQVIMLLEKAQYDF